MNIDTLTTEAQNAQAALDEARRAEAVELERINELRDRARRAVEQELMDAYDPHALAADVLDTFDAMVAAAQAGDGDLLALAVDHLAAIRRQHTDGQAAANLEANGATPPDKAINGRGRLRVPESFVTHRGGPVGDIDKHASKVLAEAIELGARRRIETEKAEREARVRAAVQAVDSP